MKLHANIAENHIEIELREQGSQIFATVNGHAYELERVSSTGDGFLLSQQGRVYDCRVAGQIESGATLDVTVGPRRYSVTLTDPKKLRSALGAGAHGEGAARIVAPMPGKVVRLLVEAGEAVDAGSGVVVVEAMKMQNEMKSPKAGTVISLNVESGATVNAGDLLAVIE